MGTVPAPFSEENLRLLDRSMRLHERAREHGWTKWSAPDERGRQLWQQPGGITAAYWNDDEVEKALDEDSERYRQSRAERWEAA